MDSKRWLVPVLLKEGACGELSRAGRKPVPSSSPCLLLFCTGALVTLAGLSLPLQRERRCSGAMLRGYSNYPTGVSCVLILKYQSAVERALMGSAWASTCHVPRGEHTS